MQMAQIICIAKIIYKPYMVPFFQIQTLFINIRDFFLFYPKIG